MTDIDLRRHEAERPDTPRDAYALLPPAATARVVGALLAASAAGWVYTVVEAADMSRMAMGLGEVGGGMSMVMAFPSFFAMWAAMMVGMMSPTVAPSALAHRAAARQRGGRAVSTAAFVAGFLSVWAATGLVGFAAYRLVLEIPASADDSRWLPALAGAVLVGVGALQFSPWKLHCLRTCRTPRASIGAADTAASVMASVRAGIVHGWRCLGCCWALMVVLLVVGVMNLAWMVVIAAIFFVDKHWARAEGLTRAAGAFLVVLGLVVIAFPDTLAFVSGVEPDSGAGGMPM